MEGKDNNNNYVQKTLKVMEKNKIIKHNDIKSIKSMTKCDKIFKLIFISSEDKDDK